MHDTTYQKGLAQWHHVSIVYGATLILGFLGILSRRMIIMVSPVGCRKDLRQSLCVYNHPFDLSGVGIAEFS